MKICIGNELLISQYMDGELTPEQETEVREHLASCPACREYYEELLFIREQINEIEYPEDLHQQIMSAVKAEKKSRKLRFFPLPKAAGAVAAALIIGLVGIGGLRSGVLDFYLKSAKPEAANMAGGSYYADSVEKAEEVQNQVVMEAEEPKVESVQQADLGQLKVYKVETRMKGWFSENGVLNDTNAVSGAADSAPSENAGPSDVDLWMEAEAESLGDAAKGYGFYILTYGQLEKLPDIFADRVGEVMPGSSLLINVKNDPKVMNEVGVSLTMSGFEVYHDSQGKYFDIDPDAEYGLVIIELAAE